jgi:hypothetical protein
MKGHNLISPLKVEFEIPEELLDPEEMNLE